MTVDAPPSTDLARERAEQQRWRLRSRFSRVKVFDRLVENEFLSEEEHRAQQNRRLARLVRYTATRIPYYRDLLETHKLKPQDLRSVADLPKLPLLDKSVVRVNDARLQPAELPRGARVYGVAASSGTTGQPMRIVQAVSANAMFTYLTQRSYRWFRFDPAKPLAFIRTAYDLPRRPDGQPYADGVTCRWPRWRYAGSFFHTGPWFGLTMTTPVERQIAWLQEIGPAYLGAPASWLEYLTYATQGRVPADGIEAVIGVVEQMTPPMRRRIERVFAVPVQQNYGLNEVGLVAVRCHAGRYHVHAEHCIVEIVDEVGQPCPPGSPGRIAVTVLTNPAMPLIRYDTDDMAETVAEPCPCGRTLPAFANLVGRYRRYISVPEGSYNVYRALRTAVNEMPDELTRNLRQFQMHQYRDDRFELRLATVGPLPAAFRERVHAAWQAVIGDRRGTLSIVEVDEILRGPSGKFQDFTSDYMPPPDVDTVPQE